MKLFVLLLFFFGILCKRLNMESLRLIKKFENCCQKIRHILLHIILFFLMIVSPILYIVYSFEHTNPFVQVFGITIGGSYGILMFIRLTLQALFALRSYQFFEKCKNNPEKRVQGYTISVAFLPKEDDEFETNEFNNEWDRKLRVYSSCVGCKEDLLYFQQNVRSIYEQSRELDKIFFCIDGKEKDDVSNKLMWDYLKEYFREKKEDVCVIELEDDETFIDFENPKEEYKQIVDRNKDKKIFITYKPNGGKRSAQYTNVALMSLFEDHYLPDLVYFTDSDTISHTDCIKNLIISYQHCQDNGFNIGGIGGRAHIDIEYQKNKGNPLVFLQSLRYFIARMIEMAAQSYFGYAYNITGPCGLFNFQALTEVLPEWFQQMYCCQRATFGDDTHLTNMLQSKGYNTFCTHLSKVTTQCPRTLPAFCGQQERWNKSGIRQNKFILTTYLDRLPLFIQFDMIGHNYFYISVTGYIIYIMSNINVSINVWFGFLNIVNTVSFLRSLLLLPILKSESLKLRDIIPVVIGYSLFGFFFINIMIPIRLMAFIRQRDIGWNTNHTVDFLPKNIKQTIPIVLWSLSIWVKTVSVVYLQFSVITSFHVFLISFWVLSTIIFTIPSFVSSIPI
jgi:cellulose synthase/poly-beta-1,6-N-acetylglucosamine synthase-like glycosyltransferase